MSIAEHGYSLEELDIDFCKERRGEVIQYVKDRYGEANVAQIGTFGTLAARAAIRDVGRTLGIPLARVNQVVAMVPEVLGITLDKALLASDDLRKTYEGDGEIRELIKNGITDLNQIKAISRAGMGPCGSKTCDNLIRQIMREKRIPPSKIIENVRRPVFVEVPLGKFAAGKGGNDE